MAIPFLSNIDLNKNQALNLVLHNKTSNPSNPVQGQLYWKSDVNKAYVYNGSAWVNIGGDITSVDITAGTGLTGTVATTEGAHTQTLNVVGGDGITANANEIETTVDDSSIELSATDGSGALRVKALGVTNAMLAGSIANAKLLNSTISGISLGSNLANLTLDDVTLQLNSGTTYNGSAAKTLSAKTAAIANGGAALATADQIHTFVTTQTDEMDADTAGNAATATLASTVTVTESTSANTNFNIVYHDGSNGLLDESSGGGFFYNPSTEQLTVKNLNVTVKTTQKEVELINTSSGVIFEGDTADDHETTLDVVDPTADRTILLPNLSGTVALTDETHSKVTKLLSGDGTNTTYEISHSFATPIVMVQVLHYGNAGTGATYDVVNVEVQRKTDNAVDLIFGTAPTATEDYLVLVSKFPAIT